MKTKGLLFFALGLTACSSPTTQEETVPDGVYCYKNTFGPDSTSTYQDVEKLNFTIQKGQVSGELVWLPAYKDARKGIITGKAVDNKLEVLYSFMQEGQKDSVVINMEPTETEIILTYAEPEKSLSKAILKIECEK